MFLTKFVKTIFHLVFATSDKRVSIYINALHYSKKNEMPRLGMILSRRLQRHYGVFLPYEASFDSSLELKHPCGIIIGEGVIIGRNVKIFQNVTLGRSDIDIPEYPKIGENVVICAGAVVLGGIEVGNNSIIGANAVVNKDVPDNSIAIGVPAKNRLRI